MDDVDISHLTPYPYAPLTTSAALEEYGRQRWSAGWDQGVATELIGVNTKRMREYRDRAERTDRCARALGRRVRLDLGVW